MSSYAIHHKPLSFYQQKLAQEIYMFYLVLFVSLVKLIIERQHGQGHCNVP